MHLHSSIVSAKLMLVSLKISTSGSQNMSDYTEDYILYGIILIIGR